MFPRKHRSNRKEACASKVTLVAQAVQNIENIFYFLNVLIKLLCLLIGIIYSKFIMATSNALITMLDCFQSS
jgi:hypothetical protein